MTRYLPIVFVLCCLANCNTASDEQQIKTVFNNYTDAILEKNGNEAAKYIDIDTRIYFDDILNCIKTCDSSAMQNYTPYQKFIVLLIRHMLPNKSILDIKTGAELYATTVNLGFANNEEQMNNTKIIKVSIDDDIAITEMANKTDTLVTKFYFQKENKEWRFSVVAFIYLFDKYIENYCEENDVSENDYIETAVLLGAGKPFSKSLWHESIEFNNDSLTNGMIGNSVE